MSRKQRRWKPQSKSALPALQARKSSHRKQWSDESMVSAIDIAKGGMSVNWAATLYDVPRTILQDRVKWQVKHRKKPGLNSCLTSAEEEQLAFFFMEVSKVGYSKTRREVKLLVEAIAQEKGSCEVRSFLMDSFIVFWRGGPVSLCEEEVCLPTSVWKPWTLRQRMNISSPLRKPKRTWLDELPGIDLHFLQCWQNRCPTWSQTSKCHCKKRAEKGPLSNLCE